MGASKGTVLDHRADSTLDSLRDPDFGKPGDGAKLSPERAMWGAVILAVWAHAISTLPDYAAPMDHAEHESCRRWLTRPNVDLETVCDFAELSAETVIRHARAHPVLAAWIAEGEASTLAAIERRRVSGVVRRLAGPEWHATRRGPVDSRWRKLSPEKRADILAKMRAGYTAKRAVAQGQGTQAA
jgi:hypothetical protein